MTCGMFDLSCHVNVLLAGLWWLPWLIYGALGLFALVALAKIKELAGWPGVFAVLTLGAYGYGYLRGRRDEPINPIEHVDPHSPDAAPSHPKPKPHTPGKRQGIPGFDPETGTWK